MYKLSRVIQAHKRDVRCLDYFEGVLVTGGSDKCFKMFTYKAGEYTLINTVNFESEVISIKINKAEPTSTIYLVLGLRNGEIHAFDKSAKELFKIVHSSTISSVDFIDGDSFVTGSWNGIATVWSVSTQKAVCEFKEGKHAVCVFHNKVNGYITSGSQDKALSIWDKNTAMKMKRVQNAHNDIIREIADIDGSGMIITCSNDESLKIWSGDLEIIQTLLGHTAFIFSVKSISLGLYVSGGEDKTLKVWQEDHCIQDIQLPGSIWNIAFDEHRDIFAACTDGIIRTFTTNEQRRADVDVEEIFNKQILQSSSKKSGMSEEDIRKLATTQQMNSMPGKKEGEIRVFRSGMVPEAFMWQNAKWDKIGDVITEGGGSGSGGAPPSEPKYYPGDIYFQEGVYDYLFDVDDQSGVPKVIPFNDGGNPMEAAEKYCIREKTPKSMMDTIRKFLIQNSSKIPRTQQQQKAQQKQVSKGLLKCTPAYNAIEYLNIKNPQALFGKIKQFNERADEKKLNEREIVHIQRIVMLLENEKTYHGWKLDFKELDSFKKVLSWPKDLKLPVWDMLRAFLKHYQSEGLFSGLEAGGDIITQLAVGLETQYPEAIYTLILKTLSNILIQNTNKGGMLRHADIAFSSISQISKRDNLKSPNYLSAMASFLYNFSIACVQKKLQKEEILDTLAALIHKRLELDETFENRTLLLQTGANILYKYHKERGQKYQFLLNYLQGDEVSSDIKLFY